MKTFLSNLAATLIGSPSTTVDIPSHTPEQVLHSALNITYGLAATIAIIVIIIAGISYATSAGDSGSMTKAKNMILYAVIGLVVIILAFAITSFVIGSFS